MLHDINLLKALSFSRYTKPNKDLSVLRKKEEELLRSKALFLVLLCFSSFLQVTPEF